MSLRTALVAMFVCCGCSKPFDSGHHPGVQTQLKESDHPTESSGLVVSLEIEAVEIATVNIHGEAVPGAKATLRNAGSAPVWYLGRAGRVTSYSAMPAREPIPEFHPRISRHHPSWSRLDPGESASFTKDFENIDPPIRLGTRLRDEQGVVTMQWSAEIGDSNLEDE